MTQFSLVTPNGLNFRTDSPVVAGTSVSEIVLVSGTVKANQLSLVNRLKSTLYLTINTKTLVPGTLTFRFYYGSKVLVLGGGALALLGGQSNGPAELFVRLANQGTTSNQFLYGKLTQGGGALTLSSPINIAFTNGAMDSTIDQPFQITAQFSVNDANNNVTMQDFEMEIS